MSGGAYGLIGWPWGAARRRQAGGQARPLCPRRDGEEECEEREEAEAGLVSTLTRADPLTSLSGDILGKVRVPQAKAYSQRPCLECAFPTRKRVPGNVPSASPAEVAIL